MSIPRYLLSGYAAKLSFTIMKPRKSPSSVQTLGTVSLWSMMWRALVLEPSILKPKGVISDVEFHESGHSLKPVSSVKLLGVKIDERLSFDDHISVLCAKASHQINALRRIVKYLTLENRMSIYNTFIASNFNYCNTVWHFCSNRSLYKLEKLHKQALGVVLNDYSLLTAIF